MSDQRTGEQLNAVIGEWHVGKQFTLQKRGLYYRPNAAGYTFHLNEAWHLTLEEAKKREYNPKGCEEPVLVVPIPWKKYTEDLNACHEAENKWCDQIAPEDGSHPRYRLSHEVYNIAVPYGQQPFRATARQRAEALVRVIEQQKGQG